MRTILLKSGSVAAAFLGLSALPATAAADAPVLNCNDSGAAWAVGSTATVSTVAAVAATSSLPAHCRITGKTGYGSRRNIGFEIRLPQAWNNRFFFQGGGGTDGFVSSAVGKLLGGQDGTALAKGYAVVSTDSGHDSTAVLFDDLLQPYGSISDFGQDFQMRVDYGYRALGVVTTTAKSILAKYYGHGPSKSYFVGCSNGGRQGFEAAARFGGQFDGVLAGAPAFNIAKQVFQAVQDAQLLSTLAAKPGDALTSSDMRLVSQKVLTACDALDFASDGIVTDTVGCQTAFHPTSLLCTASQTTDCLSPAKFAVLTKMMAGAKTSSGTQIYADWVWEPSMATNQSFASWRTWRLESITGFGYPIMAWLGGGALAQVISTPPTAIAGTAAASYEFLKTFNIDGGYANLFATTTAFPESAHSLYDVPDPTHLTGFKAHKGKIIVFSGAADPTVSITDVTKWYQGMTTEDAKVGVTTSSYAKLYVVPGMNHCGGGMATDKFDLFGALENWVQNGTAPGNVTASISSGNSDIPFGWSSNRERPLCAYPQIARHRGTRNALGFLDYVNASSYACQ